MVSSKIIARSVLFFIGSLDRSGGLAAVETDLQRFELRYGRPGFAGVGVAGDDLTARAGDERLERARVDRRADHADASVGEQEGRSLATAGAVECIWGGDPSALAEALESGADVDVLG